MNVIKFKELLDDKVIEFNRPNFIEKDPITIPHQFSKKQDIEIAGLFASTLAWGNRSTIIKNCDKLMQWMDYAPHQFITQHQPADLKPFLLFVHRTFNATDLLYFIAFLHHHYCTSASLETAFSKFLKVDDDTIASALIGFHDYFFSLHDYPERTKKHVATPAKHSACKRLNMYLRWMVRNDNNGVDFGIWKNISPKQLICPLDTHSSRVARKLGLLTRSQNDWQSAMELTNNLKRLDANDPVKYDFALFGMGVMEKFLE